MRFEFSFKLWDLHWRTPSWPVSLVIKPTQFISTFTECLLPVKNCIRFWEWKDDRGQIICCLEVYWTRWASQSEKCQWDHIKKHKTLNLQILPVSTVTFHESSTTIPQLTQDDATEAETHFTPPKTLPVFNEKAPVISFHIIYYKINK